MLTTKNWDAPCVLMGLLTVVMLSACRPSGPDALLEGERLIHERKYDEAIDRLRIATRLLPGNAQAWNHLGLAYHGAGEWAQAGEAYRQALQRNPNLAVAHFNSGLLALEQNDPLTAITNFTKFTVWQRDSPEGWLKLGAAQLRAGQGDAAEKSFQAALKLRPGQAEALNGVGVAQARRRQFRAAMTNFSAAIQAQPEYGPAMLNLAIMTHPIDPRVALQRYKSYVSAHPEAPNASAVREIVQQLEHALLPPQKPLPNSSAPPSPGLTNHLTTVRVASNPPPASPITNLAREPFVSTRTQQVAKAETPAPRTDSSNRPSAKASEPTSSDPQEVRVAVDAPVTKTVIDVPVLPTAQTNATTKVTSSGPARSSTVPPENRAENSSGRSTPAEEKRPLSERLNPANWFPRNKPPPITTPLDANSRRTAEQTSPPKPNLKVVSTPAAPPSEPLPKSEPSNPPLAPPPWPRYAYRSPEKPASGDRAHALDAVARGVDAHRQRRLSDAVQSYREATQLDPGFFEAHYNLGLAAYELKNWPLSLSAYETALSINPTSTDGRFNFALALDRAGYPLDAAEQLEKLIGQHPNEARAHFSLARLNAEELNRPSAAVHHYQKVLELEPRHPQASAIRQWLIAQPLR